MTEGEDLTGGLGAGIRVGFSEQRDCAVRADAGLGITAAVPALRGRFAGPHPAPAPEVAREAAVGRQRIGKRSAAAPVSARTRPAPRAATAPAVSALARIRCGGEAQAPPGGGRDPGRRDAGATTLATPGEAVAARGPE